MSQQDSLREVLGGGAELTDAYLQQLLQDADNNLDAAIALYFSGGGAGPSTSSGNPATDSLTMLRMLGLDGSDEALQALLQRAGNTVDAAVDLYYEEGGIRDPAPFAARFSPRRTRAQARQQQSTAELEVVNVLGSEENAEAAAGPGDGEAATLGPASAQGQSLQPPAVQASAPSRAGIVQARRQAAAAAAAAAAASPALGPSSDPAPAAADPVPAEAATVQEEQEEIPPAAPAPEFRIKHRKPRRLSVAASRILKTKAVSTLTSIPSDGETSATSDDDADSDIASPNRSSRHAPGAGMLGISTDEGAPIPPYVDYYNRDKVPDPFCELGTPYICSADRLLDLPTIATCKSMQPPYPVPLSELQLPLRQHRLPEDQGCRLFTIDPAVVPENPVPPPQELPAAVELGTITMPLLPTNRLCIGQGASQHLYYNNMWWGGTEPWQEQSKTLKVLQRVLGKVVPLTALRIVVLNPQNIYNPSYYAGHGWASNAKSFGLAVLKGTPCYGALLKIWLAEGLKVHHVQTYDQRVVTSTNVTECIVFGNLPMEHTSFLRAFALLTPMPLDPNIHVCSHRFPQQADVCELGVSHISGLGQDNAEETSSVQPPASKKSRCSPSDSTVARMDGRILRPDDEDDTADTQSAATLVAGAAAQARGAMVQDRRGRHVAGPTAQARGAIVQDRQGGHAAGRKRRAEEAEIAQEQEPQWAPPSRAVYVKLKAVLYPQRLLDAQRVVHRSTKARQPMAQKMTQHQRHCAQAFADILHALLVRGRGLWLGPDCDGLLNFCDEFCVPHAAQAGATNTPAPAAAQAGKGKSGKKPARGRRSGKENKGATDAPSGGAVTQPGGTPLQPRDVNGSNAVPTAAAGATDGTEQAAASMMDQKVAGMPLSEYVTIIPLELERQRCALVAAQKEKETQRQEVTQTRQALAQAETNLHNHLAAQQVQEDGQLSGAAAVEECKKRVGLLGYKLHRVEQRYSQAIGNMRAKTMAVTLTERAAAVFVDAGMIDPTPLQLPHRESLAGSSRAPPPSLPPPVSPTSPDVFIGLILAAEKVGGQPLLQRDSTGRIARLGVEQVRGAVCGREHVPAPRFGVHALLDSVAMPSNYPLAEAPSAVKTKPKHFQLQGLSWMLAREHNNDALGRGLLHLHPMWLQFVTKSGFIFYINRLSPYQVSVDFVPASIEANTCGGFLCDEMGLGKSLESLMLILSNPPPADWAVTDDTHPKLGTGGMPVPIKTTLLVVPNNLVSQWTEEMAKHVQPTAIRWGLFVSTNPVEDGLESPRGTPKKEGADADAATEDSGAATQSPSPAPQNSGAAAQSSGAAAQNPGAAPQNPGPAAQNTATAAAPAAPRRNTRAHSTLPTLPSTGRAKAPKPVEKGSTAFVKCMCTLEDTMVPINQLDVVLLSYEQLRKELTRPTCPLLQYGFWRIMLDEAQLVANTNSVAAAMASSLWRRHAWVVTGTPISSKLGEVAGLCEFLDATPFYTSQFWEPQLIKPYDLHTRGGLLAMRGLLQGLMLRRTKAQVQSQLGLPPCIREDRVVALSRVERAVYDDQLNEVRQSANALRAARKLAIQQRYPRHPEKARATARMMAGLTALRQACCHPHIVKQTDNKAKANERASMRKIMGRLVMQAYSALDTAAVAYFTARMNHAAIMEIFNLYVRGPLKLLEDYAALQTREEKDHPVPLLQLRLEVQANCQLASLYDFRATTDLRSKEGCAALAMDQIVLQVAQDVQKLQAVLAQIEAQGPPFNGAGLLEPNSGSLLASVPQEWVTFDPTGLNSIVPLEWANHDPTGPSSAPSVSAGGGPPFLVHVPPGAAAARDSRPYGQLPSGAFTAKSVLAVLHSQPGNPYSNLKPSAARGANLSDEQVAQVAAQAELDAEIKACSDQQKERVRRWRKLECDLHAVHAYVQRKRYADCPDLAQQAELKAFVPQRTGASSNMPAQLQTASGWGFGHQPSARAAAVTMLATRQRMNAIRQELGMDPVQDVDKAVLRRSKREARAGQLPDALAAVMASSDEEEENWEDFDGENVKEKRDKLENQPEWYRDKRRKRRMEPDGTWVVVADLKRDQQLPAVEKFLRSDPAIRSLATLMNTGYPPRTSFQAVQNAQKALQKAYHDLQHLLNKEKEALDMMGGSARASEGGASAASTATTAGAHGTQRTSTAGSHAPAGGGAQAGAQQVAAGEDDEGQPDTGACPICLDEIDRRTVTVCGHHFCADCIGGMIQDINRPRGVNCPICRRPITQADLFETLTPEEEEALKAERARELSLAKDNVNQEYGAKVAALLKELADIAKKDPEAKSLVLSSWGRLLRLVQEALTANGIGYATFAGGSPAARQMALHKFHNDPECRVLLLMMSTAGGAAGLTLTRATTAFLMEPSLNPGLEAQAAARIHRLGQMQPTRVIRLIAANTVEHQVMDLQRHKMNVLQQKPVTRTQARLQASGNVAGTSAQGAGQVEGEDEEPPQQVEVGDERVDDSTLLKFFGSM